MPVDKRIQYDWDSVAEMFGRIPDSHIAEKLGCAVSNVAYHRSRMGISACPRKRWRKNKKRPSVLWRPWTVKEDRIIRSVRNVQKVSAMTGRSVSAIRGRARNMGVWVFEGQVGEEEKVTLPRPPQRLGFLLFARA